MIKITRNLLLLLLLACNLHAQQTEIKYLSGTDRDHTITWDFFCTHGMNSNKWTTIQVPSQWEQQGFGSYKYGNINLAANERGFYKYKFTVPQQWKNKKVYIVFEGSMTDTEVKINGTLAGPIHQGAFYQFER
jgi:beta-galactosidase/beta-glucuronidase